MLFSKMIIHDIEIGKCEGCRDVVYDVNNMTKELETKMKDYGVKAVPTTVIDGKIKVVGVPDFPWVCGDDLYNRLKEQYSFK
jgi:hypothetical protein